MDNVSFHPYEEIRIFLDSNGHLIKSLLHIVYFQPNKIYVFTMDKYRAVTRTNNKNELMGTIDGFKDVITVENCENYVRHCNNKHDTMFKWC